MFKLAVGRKRPLAGPQDAMYEEKKGNTYISLKRRFYMTDR
jgi:hypothetical protein